MAQIINTNISSLTAQRNLNNSQSANRTSLERLSSGLRINSAKDDAAGLAISTRFTSQIKGIDVAIRNAGDGISLAQTAEGALGSMTSNLQRIRELALQSSNATNSDVDREALNAEAQQLISEITRSGEQTNFNGTNLLDGNLEASFQIGANRGEVVTFGIAELTASSLGGARAAGLSAQGSATTLGNGDLVINGASVGASVATADNTSFTQQQQGAIAKVAAINKVSDESGVTATVNTNTVGGSVQTAAETTGSITLNGTSIAMSTGGVDALADRQAVVAAINARSGETGVTAADSGTVEGGVSLAAADGRNITLAFNDDKDRTGFVTAASTANSVDLTAASTGLAAQSTYVGGFTLTSAEAGTPIVLSQGTGNITNAGLAAGTYTANTSAITSTARTGDATTAISSLSSGDIVINGVGIGAAQAADDTASNAAATSSNLAGSGIATAAVINRSTDATGVTAVVNATVVSGGNTTTAGTALDAGNIYINNISVGTVTLSGDGEQDRSTAVDLINTKSGQTGVVATDNGNGIDLTAADGRNISVAIDTDPGASGSTFTGINVGLDAAVKGIGEADMNGAAAGYAAAAETTTSTVRLESSRAFTLEAGSTGESTTAASVTSTVTAAALDAIDLSNAATNLNFKFELNGTSVTVDTLADGDLNVAGIQENGDVDATSNAILDGQDFIAAFQGLVDTALTAAGLQAGDVIVGDVTGDGTGLLTLTTAGTGVGQELKITEADDNTAADGVTASGFLTRVDISNTGASVSGLSQAGLSAGTFGGSETGQFLVDVDITTVDGALNALDAVDNALQAVSSERANLGAIQNRLQSTIDNLAINSENLQSANSRIQDADFAAETAELSRTQVLQQAGISILAQANAAPQQVLALLQ
jgi:flagellin